MPAPTKYCDGRYEKNWNANTKSYIGIRNHCSFPKIERKLRKWHKNFHYSPHSPSYQIFSCFYNKLSLRLPQDNLLSNFLQLTLNIKRFESQTNTGGWRKFSLRIQKFQFTFCGEQKIDICITYKQMFLHQNFSSF